MRLASNPRRRCLLGVLATLVLIGVIAANERSLTSADATAFDGQSVIAYGPRTFNDENEVMVQAGGGGGTFLVTAQVPIFTRVDEPIDVDCQFSGGQTIAPETPEWQGTKSRSGDGGSMSVPPGHESVGEVYPTYETLTLTTVRTAVPGQITMRCNAESNSMWAGFGNVRLTVVKINAQEDSAG